MIDVDDEDKAAKKKHGHSERFSYCSDNSVSQHDKLVSHDVDQLVGLQLLTHRLTKPSNGNS